MVQVDIFWSYAIGAGFSLAAFRQLKELNQNKASSQSGSTLENREKSRVNLFDNMFFVKTLLYISVLFAPSGVYLLWAFPSWETMHVGTYETIPAYIVALFAITNVTQGILGYWITYKLSVAGKYYLAFLQPIIGYSLMFFVLVNGWDNVGYQRFFSATREQFLNWDKSTAFSWFSSNVALTLYAMGVVLIPVMMYMISSWLKKGYATSDNVDMEKAAKTSPAKIIILFLTMILGVCVGMAIIATLLIHHTGWIIGTLSFLVIFYTFGISKIGLFRIFFKNITLLENE